MPRTKALSITLTLCTAMPTAAVAQSQSPIIYPSQSQSIEQQATDERTCRSWAQQQTGFDPSYAPHYQSPSSQGQGSVVRGAVGGAAIGVVGGAIGGDVGKGAAIGAGVGATAGLLGRARKQSQQDQANQQAQQTYNAQLAQHNRAFGACMSGRGYTVN
jgi:hypothetical protein